MFNSILAKCLIGVAVGSPVTYGFYALITKTDLVLTTKMSVEEKKKEHDKLTNQINQKQQQITANEKEIKDRVSKLTVTETKSMLSKADEKRFDWKFMYKTSTDPQIRKQFEVLKDIARIWENEEKNMVQKIDELVVKNIELSNSIFEDQKSLDKLSLK